MTLCQNTLGHFNYHMTSYGCNFNSITTNPISTSGIEIRFHFYYTVTIGRPLSPLFDEALNNTLITRLNRGLSAEPDPHLHSSFLGSPDFDFE